MDNNNNNNNNNEFNQFQTKQQLDNLLLLQVANDIESVFQKKRILSDFTIFCGQNEKPIYCHKIILDARTPYFRPFKKQINLSNYHFKVVEKIIQFIYSGKIQFDPQLFAKIYQLADEMQLNNLKIRIEKEMEDEINAENALDILLKSKKLKSDYLIQFCENFIRSNLQEFLLEDQLKFFDEKEFFQLVEILSNSEMNEKNSIPEITQNWMKIMEAEAEDFENIYETNFEEIQKKGVNFFEQQDNQIQNSNQNQNLIQNQNQNQNLIQNLNQNDLDITLDSDLESEGIPQIINTMQKFPRNPNKQEICCSLIHGYSKNEGNRNQISRLNGIEVTIKAMNNFPDHKNIQLHSMGILSSLCVKQENRIEIRKLNGIQSILNAMKKFPNDETLHLRCCSTLANLAVDGENKNVIRRLNGIEAIIITMNSFPTNQYIQSNSCRVLANLALKKKNRAEIRKLNGIGLIIKAINSFPKNKFLQTHCCRGLANLAVNSQNRNEIRKLKGIEAIMNSSNFFPDNGEIQKQICRGFSNLSQGNNENIVLIGKLKGVEMIINLLSKFIGLKELQYFGFCTLFNLSSNEEIRIQIKNLNVIQLATKAKKKFPKYNNLKLKIDQLIPLLKK